MFRLVNRLLFLKHALVVKINVVLLHKQQPEKELEDVRVQMLQVPQLYTQDQIVNLNGLMKHALAMTVIQSQLSNASAKSKAHLNPSKN